MKFIALFSFFIFILIPSNSQAHPNLNHEPGVILYKLKHSSLKKPTTPKFLKKYPTKSIENIFPETASAVVQKEPSVTDKNAGLLKNIYKVILKNEKDLERALVECEKDPAIEYCQHSFNYESNAFPQELPSDPEYLNPANNNQTIYNFHNLNTQVWQKSLGVGVVVGVLDSPILLDHEDLQDNIWINAKELPCYDWRKNGTQVCVDKNNDGAINLAELKAAGLGDTNADGIIELLDIFGSIFDDNKDHDGNGKINDFIGWNFVNNNNYNYRKEIYNFHGSAVAGVIGAISNDKGSLGVAPKVRIMAIQAAYDTGSANSVSTAKQAASIKYASETGANIINYSRGTSTPNGEDLVLKEAVTYSINKGTVFVTSAGNGNKDVIKQSPADFDSVIAVGALAVDGNRYTNSNYGQGITVWAMADSNVTLRAETKDSYYGFSYTSAAAPVVAGAVALLMSKNINEVPDANSPRRIQASEYKGLIQKTCRKTGVIEQGFEICALDALALVNVSAPILSPITPKNASVGELIQFSLSAVENNPNDRVTGIKALRTTLPDGSVINGLPQGAELTAVNNATANFRWTPSVSLPDGEYKIEFQADNTMGLKDIQTAVINIVPPQQTTDAQLYVKNLTITNLDRGGNVIFVNDGLGLKLEIANSGTTASPATITEVCVHHYKGLGKPTVDANFVGPLPTDVPIHDKTCSMISTPSIRAGDMYLWTNVQWPVKASSQAGENYVTVRLDVLNQINHGSVSNGIRFNLIPHYTFTTVNKVQQNKAVKRIERVVNKR